MSSLSENYKELLQIGIEKEQEAQNLLINLFDVEIIEIRDDYKYDFKTNDNITYEVKYDRMTQITNNFFIEYKTVYYNNGTTTNKLTGISTSKADKYILINTPDTNSIIFYIMDTNELKKSIEQYNYTVKCCNTYDNNITSMGYIIPSSEILKISKIFIKTLDRYFNIDNKAFKQ
jgi:hypothetical protein